jgi:hypothetical protein
MAWSKAARDAAIAARRRKAKTKAAYAQAARPSQRLAQRQPTTGGAFGRGPMTEPKYPNKSTGR